MDAELGVGNGHELSYTDSTLMHPHAMSHNQIRGNHGHDINCQTREQDYLYQERCSGNGGNGLDVNIQLQMHNNNSNNMHSKATSNDMVDKKYVLQTDSINQSSSPGNSGGQGLAQRQGQVQGLCHVVNYNISQGDTRNLHDSNNNNINNNNNNNINISSSSSSSSSSIDVGACPAGMEGTTYNNQISHIGVGEEGSHRYSILHTKSHALTHTHTHTHLNDPNILPPHRHLSPHYMTNEGEKDDWI